MLVTLEGLQNEVICNNDRVHTEQIGQLVEKKTFSLFCIDHIQHESKFLTTPAAFYVVTFLSIQLTLHIDFSLPALHLTYRHHNSHVVAMVTIC